MMPANGSIATQFLGSRLKRRLELISDDTLAPELTNLLGSAGYAQYRALAASLPGHLAGPPKTLIFLPGIMGSLLKSDSHGGIWWIDVRTRTYIDRLRLAPDGLADAQPRDDIRPVTTDIAYDPFLSVVLERDEFGHVTFPYDWRKPLQASTVELRNLIRTTFAENGQRDVHLVAHSMGGLVLRMTLAEYGAELRPLIGRIVFIATPHYGSGAIAGYLKNHLWGFDVMALMGMFLSRETFRSLWGALSLLPAPAGVYPGTRPNDPVTWHANAADRYAHPCANFDLYAAEEWKLDLTASQRDELQTVLNGVAAQYSRLTQAHADINAELRERMLVIAGFGYETLFRLRFASAFWGHWEYTEKVISRIEGDPHRDGDGSVTVASAALENVTTRYARGRHGEMPNLPRVYEEVFRWLKGEPLQLDDTPRASGHLAGADTPSAAPFLDGLPAPASAADDDSGRWSELQDPARLEDLRRRLEIEQLPEFTRVKLL